MEPSYLGLHHSGELSDRCRRLVRVMESCSLCPRECRVNRLKGETGYCGTGRRASVASYNAHFGEEAPLVGRSGSGTIFLSSCNLLCSFCQNSEISHSAAGVEVEPEHLAGIMLHLAEMGCHNINFVTPSHVVPQIVEALIVAVEQGLNIPLVYNSSGYDSRETLETLEGIFDIYMPDFKFWDSKWSNRFCNAEDYRKVATEAVREMHRQVGDLLIDSDGIAMKGLLVRHLVMPNRVAGTARIMEFIATEISPNTYVNVMDQYRPCFNAGRDELIKRPLRSREYEEAVDAAKKGGLGRLDSGNRVRLIYMQ